MKKIFILLAALSFAGPVIKACDCDYSGDFLEVAPKTDMVAHVKVIRYLEFIDVYGEQIPLSMEVEVMQVIKGEETRKTIVVWGDNGAQCRPYLNQFPVGLTFVIAFYTEGNESRSGDYFISNCGGFWLRAQGTGQDATAWGRNLEETAVVELKDILKD